MKPKAMRKTQRAKEVERETANTVMKPKKTKTKKGEGGTKMKEKAKDQ